MPAKNVENGANRNAKPFDKRALWFFVTNFSTWKTCWQTVASKSVFCAEMT